jgi:hypothetical protein
MAEGLLGGRKSLGASGREVLSFDCLTRAVGATILLDFINLGTQIAEARNSREND